MNSRRAIMIKTAGADDIAKALYDTELARENARLRAENARLQAEVIRQKKRVWSYHAKQLMWWEESTAKQRKKHERMNKFKAAMQRFGSLFIVREVWEGEVNESV